MKHAAPNAGAGHTASAPNPAKLGAEALYRAHARFVAAFVARLGAPLADIDDLVQEVFLVAHRKGGYVPGPAQPRSWLAAIALRVASQARRRLRQQGRYAALAPDSVVGELRDPSDPLEERSALRRVQVALESLPPMQRAVFEWFELDGESCESIARTLERPVGTVHSRLHSARRRFVDAYAAELRAEQAERGRAPWALTLAACDRDCEPLRLVHSTGTPTALRALLQRAQPWPPSAAGYDAVAGLDRLRSALPRASLSRGPVPRGRPTWSQLGGALALTALGFLGWLTLRPAGAGGAGLPERPQLASEVSVTNDPGSSPKQAPLGAGGSAGTAQPTAAPTELEQLMRIRALLRHDPAAAKRVAQEADAQHPHGVLREEREALRVLALCALHESGATQSARRFLDEYPQSPLRGRISQLMAAGCRP